MDAAELQDHIDGCTSCKSEADSVAWLIDRLQGSTTSGAQTEHITMVVLSSFAENADEFHEDSVELLWSHLDECDYCADAYDRAQSGDTSEVKPPPASEPTVSKPEASTPATPTMVTSDVLTAETDLEDEQIPPKSPRVATSNQKAAPANAAIKSAPQQKTVLSLQNRLNTLGTQGLAWVKTHKPIAAIVVVVPVIVLVLVMTLTEQNPRGTKVYASWETAAVIATNVPMQEIRITTRSNGSPPVTDLNLSHHDEFVIGVDLDRLRKRNANYRAVVRNSEGVELFRDAIADNYFEEGRFLLRLMPRSFDAGIYVLAISRNDDAGNEITVARGSFTITK